MHVLVAIPGKHHLDGLSPFLSALGERVVPVALSPQAGGTTVLAALKTAINGQKGSAIFPTVHAMPWAIFDTLLAEATNRRAIVFYEPARLGIARKLQAEEKTRDAIEGWSSEAARLLEFVRANGRHVTLVRVDQAFRAPRALLEVCAERFLFDLVDSTIRLKAPTLPAQLHSLVAEAAVQSTPTVAALDSELSGHALALGGANAARLDDLDQFIESYQDLLDDKRELTRLRAEADALRTASVLAEKTAQALRHELTQIKHEALSSPAGDARLCGRAGRLDADEMELRQALADVQAIAELHVSEAADLRARLEHHRRENKMLRTELEEARSQAPTARQIREEEVSAVSLPQNSVELAKPAARKRATGFRPRAWLQIRREAKLVAASGFFDAVWYKDHNPDVDALGANPVKHFVRHGGQEGRAPGPAFSSRQYLADYQDVAREGLNPLVHYLRLGRSEGRKIHQAE